jgi:hypothetical protein
VALARPDMLELLSRASAGDVLAIDADPDAAE